MGAEKPLINQRWILVIFLTIASALIFVLRYNLSVCIVAMVAPLETGLIFEADNSTELSSSKSIAESNNQSNLAVGLQKYQDSLLSDAQLWAATSLSASTWLSAKAFNLLSINQSQPSVNHSETVLEEVRQSFPLRTFNWDESTQGQILSSYFYGYLAFQILGGRWCERFGPKWVLAAGVVLPGILSFFTPLSAFMGPTWLMVNRMMIGSFHAMVLSSCYAFVALWMPIEDKGKAVIWLNIGFEMGGCFGLILSSLISSHLGWEYAFYLLGILPLIWMLPYIFMVYSTPEQHPRLSNYERKLIENSKVTAKSCNEFSNRIKRVPPVLRWGTVLTSRAVWANVSAKITGYFCAYLLATKMPNYLDEIYGLSLNENGAFCSMSYLGIIGSKLLCLKLSPWIQSKRWFSMTTQHKIFQCTAMLSSGVCLLLLNMIEKDVNVATGLIVLIMFGLGMQCAGEAANLAEFAQDLSGSIFGFANSFTCLDGVFAPIVVGKILETVDDKEFGWKLVFWISSAMCFLGAILFALFADSTPQKWAMAQFVEEPNSSDNSSDSPKDECSGKTKKMNNC